MSRYTMNLYNVPMMSGNADVQQIGLVLSYPDVEE